ncbi:MAG TPA: tryptophan--tRNA ligase [Patescibacteria group bacterium]|nr:tryptophan--tRNA ligase [Patescibacteria group bacterium]
MTKLIVVSGMQPSGPLHIGNYLGALKNWVEIQNSGKYDCFFFVADYHSISEDYDPKHKKDQTLELVADYLSAGIDPAKSTIFVQSQVPLCTELAWVFNTVTPVAEMERMTQFKDKSARQKQNINMGLFDYPVLQAADILIYKGEFVPVGEDQIQHVELTRDIARWFNNRYKKKYFPEVKPLLTPTARIMSLVSPTNKMSKSLGDKHWLGINDSPEEINKKISKAVTTKEGIENLSEIYEAFKTSMPGQFNADTMAMTKSTIAKGVADYFTDFRKRKAELLKNKKQIADILDTGKTRAEKIAVKTMAEVKRVIGVM